MSDIVITNEPEVDAKFEELLAALDGENRYQVTEAGAVVALGIASELVPVRTGELLDSLSIEREDDEALLTATAPHAEYVEFGTSKMPAQPYMRPALDDSRVTDAMSARAVEMFLGVCDER